MTRSGTGTTDRQCEASNKMCGLRGGRELTTTQVAKQVNTGRSWMYDWKGEVPAKANYSYGGCLYCSKDVGAQFVGLASPSLRGAKRRGNLGGEANGIVTPRFVGVRNGKNAWCWMKEAATRSWRRDPQTPVSSLFLGLMSNTTISTHGAFSTGRVPVGRGQ